MNTHVQKTHRIVVGAGVALIAAAGISVVAIDVHRAVLAKTTTHAAPTALPDTSVPDASQSPQPAPPPSMADGAPVADSGAGAAAIANVASTAPNPQPSTAAPKSTRQGPSLATAHQRSSVSEPAANPPTTYGTPKASVADETAMASVPVRENSSNESATQAGATLAAGGGTMSGSNAGTAGAGPDAVDSRNLATAADATSASGEPALSGGEVTTTVQARAAGGDSANADRIITSAVQTKIAADTAGQGAGLEVTTINGVVILTGTVPTADAVEHVKQVVQQVKDVKGVDATAVRVASS